MIGCSGGEPAPGLKALPRRRRRTACGQDSVLILWKVYSVSLLSNSPIIGQLVFVSEPCRVGVCWYILVVMWGSIFTPAFYFPADWHLASLTSVGLQ